jgi:hypothetical protein
MLRTFKAILRGNQLAWADETPETTDCPVSVYVTFLEEDTTTINTISRGQQMAEILSRLSESNTLANVDPVTWQREIRQDRPLPKRNDAARQ